MEKKFLKIIGVILNNFFFFIYFYEEIYSFISWKSGDVEKIENKIDIFE
jgi:hypothetical protein